MIRGGLVPVIVGASAALTCCLAKGQAPLDAGPSGVTLVDKQQIESALKLTREAAERYEIVIDDATHRPAVLLPEPLLHWSNPAAGEVHGNVFLWTISERPVVIGSLFKWFSPHMHMSHEFHSLAERPLRAKYGDAEVWVTAAPGVSFAPVSDASPPAATPAQRLLQMRQLSKDFSATKQERDGSMGELRLLSQPIYRYAAPAEGLVDGALFAFVQGTDPDLFLLLEARGGDRQLRWYFAATRMNSVGLTLRHHDRAVWSAEMMPWADVNSHRKIYTSFTHKADLASPAPAAPRQP
jgi:hypothetical protein